jgi:hypothetical protein
MRLIHKLTLALASVSLPLAVVSVGVTLFIQAEIQELGNFHTPNLYYIQTIASETLGAIEESFAYLASGDTKEKEHFLAWARKFPARMGEFETSAALGHDEEDIDLPKNHGGLSCLVGKCRRDVPGV